MDEPTEIRRMAGGADRKKVAMLAGLLAFGAAGVAVVFGAFRAEPTPVIFISDLGTDIDDTWALAQLLRSPELEIRLLLVDPADTHYRAQIAAKFLQAAGRTDVLLAVGDNTGSKADDIKTMTPWIADFDLNKYPGRILNDGVTALIETIERSREPITVIASGPAHSLAMALQRAPQIAKKCRFVGSFGSFHRGDDGGPATAETNVRVEPAAFRTVLAAPWREIVIAPLDTTGVVRLEGERYHAIWCATADPLLRPLIESYCIFAPRQIWTKVDYFTVRSTTLYDCVAVHLAISEDFLKLQEITFDVTDDGFTRQLAGGRFRARVALEWENRDAFEGELTRRLLGRAK